MVRNRSFKGFGLVKLRFTMIHLKVLVLHHLKDLRNQILYRAKVPRLAPSFE